MATITSIFHLEKEKITVTNKNRDSMAKRLKIEGVDAISVLNFNWSMSAPLKGILRVENTTEQVKAIISEPQQI